MDQDEIITELINLEVTALRYEVDFQASGERLEVHDAFRTMADNIAKLHRILQDDLHSE